MGAGRPGSTLTCFPALSHRGVLRERPGAGDASAGQHGPAEGRPPLGSFLPTQHIESRVQFLLDLQTILKIYKNIFIQKNWQ